MRYGYLSNANNDQIDYATQASEGAYIVSQDRRFQLKLEILSENFEHSNENIYVAFRENKSRLLGRIINCVEVPEKTFYNLIVEFEVKHSYFNSLVRAVNSISPEDIKRILPTSETFSDFVHCHTDETIKSLLSKIPSNIDIDREGQFKALRALLLCQRNSPPIIVNGAFGTGKTRLLAATTYCVIQYGVNENLHVRVLICTHHNSSADHLIEQFGQMFGNRIELVRLVSKSPNRRSRFSPFYKNVHGYSGSRSRHLVMVTTFLTAPRLSKILDKEFFTHIFLDEGAQVREPEAIAPLSLAGPNTKIVVAGDSCQVSNLHDSPGCIIIAIYISQVGPSLLVLGEEARDNGLKYSLLERLQILYNRIGGAALKYICYLNTNYRCHKDIVKIPNKLFYKTEFILTTYSDASAHPHPQAGHPLLFVCCPSDRTGMFLLEKMKYFLSHWPEGWGEKNLGKACLMTSNRTQVIKIKCMTLYE